MPAIALRSRSGGLVVLALLVLAPPAHSVWLPNGNPVCNAAGNQNSAVATFDGVNGMFVAWLDGRPVAPGIYAQRILPDGQIAPGWPLNGVLLSGAAAVSAPRIVPDAAGGVLVIWATTTAIRAQRLDANGALHAGWPADGREVANTNINDAGNFQAVTDGTGGAYFTRMKVDPNNPFSPIPLKTIYLTRIDAEGNLVPPWTASGTALVSSEASSIQDLTADFTGGGGVLFGTTHWYEPGTNPHVGNAWRMRGDRTTAYVWTLPAPFTGFASDGVYHIAVASDGAVGSYWTYRVTNGMGTFYWGQHVNSAGTKLWPDYTVVPFSELVVQDGTAGVWFVGRAPGTHRLEVHRRDPIGALFAGWTAAGVVITEPTSLGAVVAEPQPGAVQLCWSENSLGSFDIRTTAVAHAGTVVPGWDPGGNAVCTATGNQLAPVLVSMATGQWLSCWVDERNGASNQDIYAMLIDPPAPVSVTPVEPPAFGIVGIAPVPARDRVSLRYGWAGEDPIVFEVVDVTGRTVIGREVAAGQSQEDFDLAGLTNGVYFVRVSQGPRVATARFAVLR